ncbi:MULTISPECIES: SPOR domain-containing protein [unclassified Bartonella]|uniref:SPOR domain-containing protein n=1 Tax=unclassified Bartonella TaxID=2645622 RepID=UPI002360360B|nr:MULTISPECIES: SPOR domain-containing protein [unclassified Bartonella]
MSDNDRKNPHEMKQDHEHHDPLERLTRIFNPRKQSESQNDHSSIQTDQAMSPSSKAPSPPEISSYDDFDLSFLEVELENNLTNDLSCNDQKKKWDLHTVGGESTPDVASTSSFKHLERRSFLPKGENSLPMNHDEEQILDALSPLPIPQNQSPQKRTTSFEKSDLSAQSKDSFFDEADKYANKEIATGHIEHIDRFSSTISQQENQKNTRSVQQNDDNNQKFYDTSVQHPYKFSANEKNRVQEYRTDVSPPSTDVFFSSSHLIAEKEDTGRNETMQNFSSPSDAATQINKHSDLEDSPQEHHTTNSPKFYEEEFLQQETYAEKNQKYNDTQTEYINAAENISEQSSKKESPYNQNNLKDRRSSSETFATNQTDSFFAHNYTHKNTPPPDVDTYKFAEELVEKTGPIMVPEVPYEAPEYDIPTDSLKEEFADVLNIGHVSEENFSRQQQQNEIFNEIFHQTMQNPREDAYTNSQNQNSNSFPTDNMEYSSSSFTESPSYKGVDETSTYASAPPPVKSFIVGKTLVKSALLFILIAIGFVGYSHFFTPSEKNEGVPIIHADNTPFKFKQESTETKDDVAHNLDIYKQTTGQNEKQENTQKFLIDNSEQPEDLAEVNQQDTTDSLSPYFAETDVDDAVNEAINHTIPTREVQTVIVNHDGTIVLAPRNLTERKITDEIKETSDQTTVEQFQNLSPVASHESDINNKETEDKVTSDIDAIIAENAPHSDIEEKFIPVPSHAEKNSQLQTHAASHPTLSKQISIQNSENYYVQLASQPTHELARNSLKKMKSKFGSLIGVRPVNIQSALIPGKGTYYRVRIQTQNRNDAISLCENIKNYGGSCFITR